VSRSRLHRLGLDEGSLPGERDAAARWMDDLSRRVLPGLLETLGDSAEDDLAPGTRMASYRLESVLGRGGMGTVYRAHDDRLDRPVAIKFLSRRAGGRDGGGHRLLDEARAAARLDHPGIAVVHEVGETDDGRPYIVMAHCDGETLADRLARGPLPLAESLDVATQLADALAAAHRARITHRDVKPSNVIIAPGGRTKVIDFGIAGSDGGTGPQGAGTLPYMSPERLEGAPSDARADVWSLGVVLHEMLTGERPFRGDDRAAVLSGIRAAPAAFAARPDVPPEVAAVLRRCLALEPEDRYGSADEVVQDLVALAPDWPARRERATAADPAASAGEHTRKGRHFLEGGDPPSVSRARDRFLAALSDDPTFAPAWCGLSDAYEQLGYLSVLPPEEAHLRARAAAERALELDPDLAAAHVSLATVLLDYYRDWTAAERHYLRALELDPAYAVGRQLYAEFLRDRGDFAEALEQIDEAIRLDPLSPYFRLVRGIVLHMARRPDDAIDAFDRLLEAMPDFPIAHFYRGLAYAGAGRHEQALAALAAMDPDGTFPDALALRGAVLGRAGDRTGAAEALARLEALASGSGYHPQPFHRGLIHLGMGDVERAITLFEEDADRRTWFSRVLKVDPGFDSIRDHPRFQALLERVGGR
jgi:serine/threonine-protein kinase